MVVEIFWAVVLLMSFFLDSSCATHDPDLSRQEHHRSYNASSPAVELNTFWKRGRGGGGSGSSDDSESSSSDSSDGDSSGGNDCCICWRKETYTKEAHNNNSYNSHYAIGNGSYVSVLLILSCSPLRGRC